MADGFKALSDPTRREILSLLRESDLTAGEISRSFDISNASLSHHFKILYEAKLIKRRREGQFIYYSLNTTIIQDIITSLLLLKGGK